MPDDIDKYMIEIGEYQLTLENIAIGYNMGKSGYNMRNLSSTPHRYPICIDVNEMTSHSINIKCKIGMSNNQIKSQGKIKSLKRLQQIPVFENLRYSITDNSGYGIQSPTDGDMIFEFQSKVIIFCDFKLEGKGLENGQNRTFTSIVDACQNGGYEGAYFITAEHTTDIDTPTYNASTCVVKRVYYKQNIHTPPPLLTLNDWLIRVFQKHNLPLTPYKPKSIMDIFSETFEK